MTDFDTYFAHTLIALERNPPDFPGAIALFYPETLSFNVVSVVEILSKPPPKYCRQITRVTLDIAIRILNEYHPGDGSSTDWRFLINFGDFTADELMVAAVDRCPKVCASLIINLCGYTFKTVVRLFGFEMLYKLMTEETLFAREFSRRVRIPMSLALSIPDFPWATDTLLLNLSFNDDELHDNITKPPFNRCTGAVDRTRTTVPYLKRVIPTYLSRSAADPSRSAADPSRSAADPSRSAADPNAPRENEMVNRALLLQTLCIPYDEYVSINAPIAITIGNPHITIDRIVKMYGYEKIRTSSVIAECVLNRPDVSRYIALSSAIESENGWVAGSIDMRLIMRIIRHVAHMQKRGDGVSPFYASTMRPIDRQCKTTATAPPNRQHSLVDA